MNFSSTHITQQDVQQRALNNERQEDGQKYQKQTQVHAIKVQIHKASLEEKYGKQLQEQSHDKNWLLQNVQEYWINTSFSPFSINKKRHLFKTSPKSQQLYLSYMPTSSIRNHKKKQMEYCYNCVSYEKRLQLLRIVLNDGVSIYRASRTLNINNSTAKVIVRNYKKYNHIFKKKAQNKQKITHIDEIIGLNEDIKISNSIEGQIKKQEQPIAAHEQTQPKITSLDKLNNFQPYYYVFVYDAPYFWNSWLV